MDDGGMLPEGTRPWSEPDPRCELFIRVSPEQQKRNVDIWAETARRLGVADG